MNIQKLNSNLKNISFTGHKREINKHGNEEHKFFYLYDKNKYNCDVELYRLENDNGNFSVGEKVAEMNLDNGPISINPNDRKLKLSYDEGFAYRFKLTNINDKSDVSYAFDNGTVIGIMDNINDSSNKYNVVLKNRAIINKNGPMQLIMPDGYNPKTNVTVAEALRAQTVSNLPEAEKLKEAEKLAKQVRSHANKLGGKFEGIIERLPEIRKEGVSRIVGTPYTKDSISSHKYWTENAYRVAPDFGTEKDFKKMQIELFKNGINWVSDAALVNEGLGGIHMSEFLRKGKDSESKNMFRASEKVALGILPNKSDFARIKFVNPEYSINEAKDGVVKNPNYNPAKPTYIQFYDSRLASKEQIQADELITTYAYNNTGNIYDITKHDDAVYPYSVEVDPHLLTRNINRVMLTKDKIDVSDYETIKNISDFENFKVVTKSEAGGIEFWDGNVDIAKLNFYRSKDDELKFADKPNWQQLADDFDRGALSVRDYAITSGQYWTKLTANTQLDYLSDYLAKSGATTAKEYMQVINEAVSKGDIDPNTAKVVDLEVIENVLDDNYHFRTLDDADTRKIGEDVDKFNDDYSVYDYITRQAMDLPLETIPVANNLLGILTSPYIAKRANVPAELGVSRFDIYNDGNKNLSPKFINVYERMDDVYASQIAPLIQEITKNIPELSDENGDVSPFGRYVLTQATPDLTKYIILKAINPSADVVVDTKTGEIDFSNVNEDEITMQSLGIPFSGKSLESEASILVNIIKNGVDSIPEEDITKLQKAMEVKFKNRNEDNYKVAEMILDRTEAGLGWRIDATKDIVSIDSRRADGESMIALWDNVIDFWTDYNQNILEINPHAYTTAEITDLADLFDGYHPNSKYVADGDAERKFIEQTGITSVANYNYFFSLLPEMFAKYSFEKPALENGQYKHWMSTSSNNKELREKFTKGWDRGEGKPNNPGFFYQSPDDGVVNSYTFIGNHDKPRVLHGLCLNMNLFFSDFSTDEDKKVAAEVLNKPINEINFSKVNGKAIAMGDRLSKVMCTKTQDKKLQNEIKKAISEIADGKFKGHTFDSDAFGTRPIDIAIKSVLDQVEANGVEITSEVREKIEVDSFKEIIEPAFDRFTSMYKLLITLPGSPTDFAGDKVGATGFETKTKNYHQQNRNVIHWDWLDDEKYSFIKDTNEKLKQIANLRTDERLSALNDGAAVSIPVYHSYEETKNNVKTGKIIETFSDNIQVLLRYNDKGSVVLTLHDLSGSNADFDKKMDRGTTSTSVEEGKFENRIILDTKGTNAKEGLKHGLVEGMIFKNISNEEETYKIKIDKIDGKDYYYLAKVKQEGGKEIEEPISIKPEDFNTLVLYHPIEK